MARINYRTVRALNPSFDPSAHVCACQRNPKADPKMQTVLRPEEIRRFHARMSPVFAPDPPTVLSIAELAEDRGSVEIDDMEEFTEGLAEDLDTLGLDYQHKEYYQAERSARERNAARRLARGDHR